MNKKDKLEILNAARDAVFQDLAEHEEQVTEYATEAALSEIEQRFKDNAEDEGWWDHCQCVVSDEITRCFQRAYAAILVGPIVSDEITRRFQRAYAAILVGPKKRKKVK